MCLNSPHDAIILDYFAIFFENIDCKTTETKAVRLRWVYGFLSKLFLEVVFMHLDFLLRGLSCVEFCQYYYHRSILFKHNASTQMLTMELAKESSASLEHQFVRHPCAPFFHRRKACELCLSVFAGFIESCVLSWTTPNAWDAAEKSYAENYRVQCKVILGAVPAPKAQHDVRKII